MQQMVGVEVVEVLEAQIDFSRAVCNAQLGVEAGADRVEIIHVHVGGACGDGVHISAETAEHDDAQGRVLVHRFARRGLFE